MATAAVATSLRAPAEAAYLPEIEEWLDRAEVVGRRRDRARRALLAERLPFIPVTRAWGLRLPVGAKIWYLLAESGLGWALLPRRAQMPRELRHEEEDRELPSSVAGGGSAASLALAAGGVLAAYRGLGKLSEGIGHLAGAWLSWRQVLPMVRTGDRILLEGRAG